MHGRVEGAGRGGEGAPNGLPNRCHGGAMRDEASGYARACDGWSLHALAGGTLVCQPSIGLTTHPRYSM